jgi:hypothetical protein
MSTTQSGRLISDLANPSIYRSFHLNNRNIDRRNDANTAEFTRTGHSLPTR